MKIYVVSYYDMIEYVGLDWVEAMRSAIRHDIPTIEVWEDGAVTRVLGTDGRVVR